MLCIDIHKAFLMLKNGKHVLRQIHLLYLSVNTLALIPLLSHKWPRVFYLQCKNIPNYAVEKPENNPKDIFEIVLCNRRRAFLDSDYL